MESGFFTLKIIKETIIEFQRQFTSKETRFFQQVSLVLGCNLHCCRDCHRILFSRNIRCVGRIRVCKRLNPNRSSSTFDDVSHHAQGKIHRTGKNKKKCKAHFVYHVGQLGDRPILHGIDGMGLHAHCLPRSYFRDPAKRVRNRPDNLWHSTMHCNDPCLDIPCQGKS